MAWGKGMEPLPTWGHGEDNMKTNTPTSSPSHYDFMLA